MLKTANKHKEKHIIAHVEKIITSNEVPCPECDTPHLKDKEARIINTKFQRITQNFSLRAYLVLPHQEQIDYRHDV